MPKFLVVPFEDHGYILAGPAPDAVDGAVEHVRSLGFTAVEPEVAPKWPVGWRWFSKSEHAEELI